MLACRVREDELARPIGLHGTDIDDFAAFLLNHDLCDFVGKVVQGVEIEFDDGFPILVGEFHEFMSALHACIVDERIDSSKFLHCLLNDLFGRTWLRDVLQHEYRLASIGLYGSSGLLPPLSVVGDDEHIRADFAYGLGVILPQATCAARDEYDFIRQIEAVE